MTSIYCVEIILKKSNRNGYSLAKTFIFLHWICIELFENTLPKILTENKKLFNADHKIVSLYIQEFSLISILNFSFILMNMRE